MSVVHTKKSISALVMKSLLILSQTKKEKHCNVCWNSNSIIQTIVSRKLWEPAYVTKLSNTKLIFILHSKSKVMQELKC